VDEGRTYTCYVAQAHKSRPEPWWWFSVSTDESNRFAPFRAANSDTRASVKSRIITWYRERLERAAMPPTPHWRRGGGAPAAAAETPGPNGAPEASPGAG
jgi:hypothetical protein